VSKVILQLASFLLAMFAIAEAAETQEKRVALVIGNGAYTYVPSLENPKNDANDIATLLEGFGFRITKGIDLDKAAMDRLIRDFAEELVGAKVGLLFYAGHGLQVSGENYLVPTDAKLHRATALDFELVRLSLIHRTMERETNTNILFLDACRNNPLSRNLAIALGTRSVQIGQGLAPVESGEGTLISFSTQPGNVAVDGSGRNSPFTKALLKHIPTPDQDLPSILIDVRNDVMAATDRQQVPWEHSALTARFFFAEPKASADQEDEVALWDSVKDSSDPAIVQSYLRKYPLGAFAVIAKRLIAALGKQEQVERLSRQQALKSEEELHKAREELQKAQEAAKAAGKRAASVRSASGDSAQGKSGGYRTCGRNGCQWVPPGCHAVRNAGGGGLGGKITCP
jgi:uncharacterized caspase-like protein